MGPTWGPSGADRTQVGPMLAQWTLLYGYLIFKWIVVTSPKEWFSGQHALLPEAVYVQMLTNSWEWAIDLWQTSCLGHRHYNDVIMSTMASQITSVSIVYSTVCSGADQRKHQSSMALAFVQGIHQWLVHSPHKGPVMQKMFPFDDIIMGKLNCPH